MCFCLVRGATCLSGVVHVTHAYVASPAMQILYKCKAVHVKDLPQRQIWVELLKPRHGGDLQILHACM